MKIEKYLEDKRIKVVLLMAFILYYLTAFMLILKSGYMYDDMWRCVDIGFARENGMTLAQYAWHEVIYWVRDCGRILVFSHYAEFALCCLPLFAYKLFIVTAIFLDAIVISKIGFELTKSRKVQYMILLIFPAVLSLDASYFSALYGFHALMQVCLLLVALALYWYIKYRNTGCVKYQVYGCIAWFIALGMYEISYVLSICFIILLFAIDGWDNIKKHFWKVIKTGLPQICIFVFWIILNVITRLFATGIYSGTTFNMDVPLIISTMLKQSSGGLGIGSTLIFANEYGFMEFLAYVKLVINWYHIAFVIIFLILFFLLAYVYRKCEVKKLGIISALGVALVILPSILIGLSSRYQEEVEWFVGYIPAYFSAWGFDLLFVAAVVGIGYLLREKKVGYWIFNVVAGLILAMCLLFNNAAGQRTVDAQSEFYQNDVNYVREILDENIFENIGEYDTVDISGATFTTQLMGTQSAYDDWLGRIAKVYAPSELTDTPSYVINYLRNEFFTVSSCNDDSTMESFFTNEIDVYVFDGFTELSYTDLQGYEKTVKLSDYSVEKTGKNGSIYTISVDIPANVASIDVK